MRIQNFIFCFLCLTFSLLCYAQEPQTNIASEKTQPEVTEQQSQAEEQTAVVESLATSENVTLDFKEADIRNVLKIISYKSGVNIVTTPEVMGNVTIRLVDVPWEKALDVILKTYGFAYEKIGNIITVASIDKLTSLKKQEVELAQVQPTITEVFNLKYIDARDAKRAVDSLLSPRGKATVLQMAPQPGWKWAEIKTTGAVEETTKLKRAELTEEEKKEGLPSKVLIVSDVPPVLNKVSEVIEKIDAMPKQVLIETRIMEINRDKLKDIGFDWGTGTTGVAAIGHVPIDKSRAGETKSTLGTHGIGTSGITPSIFGAKATGLTPTAGGLELIYRKLSGTQFEAILYALQEDVNTNTLSAPKIMVLNNQEATILVGTKYPIMEQTTTTSGSTPVTTVTLKQYIDIGIQLNVVPQIGTNNDITMVVHPVVSSSSGTLGTTVQYPILDVREAETRIFMKDGETAVIGGLLKDTKSKSIIGIPFLSKIPFVGPLFRRETNDTSKIDLVVFITAHIVKEGEFTAEEIAKLEERLERGTKKEKAIIKRKKK